MADRSECADLEAQIERVRDLCAERMAEAEDGSQTDVDTIWPSEILAALDEDSDAPTG
jgi:hypothetical protein